MRVVVIADFADTSGGAQAVAVQSAIALSRLGVPTTFVQGVDGPVDARLAEAGVARIGLGLRDVWNVSAVRGAVSGIWNRTAARHLRDALSRLPGGPTILHLHQWTKAQSPSVFPVLLGSGHPLAVTLHDYFVGCPNGLYYRFDLGEPCRLTPLSPACLVARCDPRSMAHKAIRVVRTAATRAALARRRYDVIHVSDRGRDTIAPFLPGRAVQHRVDNPVDILRRPPAEIGADAKLAYIGRLTHEKGADLVAAAAHTAGMPVMFIGDGPAEADIRRLNPAAEILGWRSREDVDRLLRHEVRAVVAPSRWYETGPLTVYEAMAAGVPVVASSRAGAAEKVRHGETGFVADPDPGALAAAFFALGDLGTVRRMGRAAYDRYWSAPLDPETHARALLAVYAGMLDRAG